MEPRRRSTGAGRIKSSNRKDIGRTLPQGYLCPRSVTAGLGRIGISGCLITKKFGAHVRLGSILATAALPPDPLVEEALCLPEKCGRLCVRLCPWDAISEEGALSHFRCTAGRSGHDIGHYKKMSTLPPLLVASRAMAYTDIGPTSCAICQIRCPMDPRMTSLPAR